MNLTSLSDKSLLSSTLCLAQKERQILSELLWHLKEIDSRKLYSDLKCSSLFDYCVKVLKYSEGQASRRVSATRLLKTMPKIMKHIESGDLNLTQLNQAHHFFNEMQIQGSMEKEKIIEKLTGKSTRESERMLDELKDSQSPKKVVLHLKEETLQRLKHVQKMNSHKCADMDSLILNMCKEVEKNWDPTLVQRKSQGARVDRRYISVGIKAAIWKRDEGQCRICGSGKRLELDHIKPFALGGLTTEDNLRLLCRNCNQRAGIKFFGENRRHSKM
jgi:5-methylcytosine-specific restriction endonuclease McrA